MTSKTFAPLLAVGLLAATVVADGGSHAADIDDLQEGYIGSAFSNTDPNNESQSFNIDVTGKQANGKFTGLIGTIPISGKVTGTGKMTFSGGRSDEGAIVRIKNGKGQLSATGLFIVGSLKVQSNSPGVTTGSFTFSLFVD